MSGPEPGWRPDPSQPDQQRWWDGTTWSDRVAPAPSVSTMPPPPAAPAPKRLRLPVWGWILAAVAATLALIFLAPVVALAALTVLITGIVALAKNSRTWLRFPSRGWAMGAIVVSALVFFASGGITSALYPGDTRAELTANSADSPRQAIAETPRSTPTPTPTPVTTVRELVVTERVPFVATTIDDGALPQGHTVITTEGRDGERTLTYRVTDVDGAEVSRELVSDVVSIEPITQVTANGTYVAPPPPPPAPAAPACDPNYADGCVPIASDVDCAGGSGNGPAYFDGVARVVGSDVYDLDSDGDGYACETW